MKFWAYVLGAALVACGLLVLVGRGSFVHSVVSLSAAAWIGAPAVVVAAVCFMLQRRSGSFKRVARWASAAAILAAMIHLSWPLGALVGQRDVAAAKAYCESLVPKLEQHKFQFGAYPRNLKSIVGSKEPPRLLRGPSFYGSDGQTYSFFFVDPMSMFSAFQYDSESRRWFEVD